MFYDAVFKEVPYCEDGLTQEEISEMFNMLGNCKVVVPTEIEGATSSAMGFINAEIIEEFNGLKYEVENILNDMNNETENGEYRIDVYNVKIWR